MTISVYSGPDPNLNNGYTFIAPSSVITEEEYKRLLDTIDKQKYIIKSLLKNATPEQLIEYVELLLEG
jgi:hypothetical protein